MTIEATGNRVSLTGNGVTTTLAFPYPVSDPTTDLVVIETIILTGVQTTRVVTTDWTWSGTPDAAGHYPDGGTITALTAPAATVTWIAYRDPPAIQSLDLVENDDAPAEAQEAAYDYLTMLIQRIKEQATRSLRQPEGDSANIGLLPAKVDRASMYCGFNSDGDPIALAAPTGTSVTTPFSLTLLDDADAVAARGTLGFPTIGSTTTGYVLVVDPAVAGGMSWNHRTAPNPIINGNFDVWQRGTSTGVITTTAHVTDRWKYVEIGAGGGSQAASRSTSVPTLAQAGVVLNYSLDLSLQVTDATIGAGETYSVNHVIEGYNWRHFAQRALVLSFWVYSPKTGTHCVALRNSGADRSYVGTYTVLAAATWEYKTVLFNASPSAGTWDYTDGVGATLSFALAVGSTYQTTAAAWQTGNYLGTSAQVNLMDSGGTGTAWRVTGVKLERGSIATPIQFRPFQEELALCQRYFQKSFLYATAPAQNIGVGNNETQFMATIAGANANYHQIHLPVIMRGSPTVVTFNPGAANAEARNETDVADCATTSVVATESTILIATVGNAGLAVGERIGIHWTADAEF